MTTYIITAPDGKEYEVDAPEGASEAEVLAYAQQNYQSVAQDAWQPTKRSVEDIRGAGQGFDPTEGQNFGQNLVQGFGKAFVDTGRGISQLFGGASEQDVQRAREIDAPLMQTGGGFIGNVAGQATQIAAPIPGGAALSVGGRLAPYLASAGRAAAFGGMQGTVDGESRAVNAAQEGALGFAGQGIADAGGALAKRAASRLPETVRESIQLARQAGIPLRADQVTQSAPLRAAAAVTKWLPFSGAGRSAQKQQEAFNAAVGRSFGLEGAPVLTDDAMRGARRALSDKFEGIYARNDVALSPAAVRKLAEIEGQAARRLTKDEADVVRNQLDDILANADDGVLTGQKYQAVRSMLQRAEGPDKVGSSVKELRKALDDIAADAVGPEDAATLKKVRSQWANLRTTEDALKQVSGAAGNVKPASLYPLIRKGSTKEMRHLAKIGQNVLKDVVPDSGTAQRAMYQSLLTGSGTAGVAGAAAGLGVIVPVAKMAAIGALAGRGLNSNVGSKLLEQGKPTKGLARLLQSSPRVLPAAGPAGLAALGIDISGGRKATQEDIDRDAEIVRRYRQQQGR